VLPQGGLRVQDGEGERQRPVVPHHARQQQVEDGGAEVRQQHEAAVRVLRRLLPHHARHALPLLRVQRRHTHRRKLLPDGRRREHVRRFPRGALPPPQEADRHPESGRDSRWRPPQVLQPALQGVPAGQPRGGQDDRALHVLKILHRLSGRQPAASQAGELPVQPLPELGRPSQVRVPHDPVSGRRRIDRLPDGPRATTDALDDRRHGIHHLLSAAVLPASRAARRSQLAQPSVIVILLIGVVQQFRHVDGINDPMHKWTGDAAEAAHPGSDGGHAAAPPHFTSSASPDPHPGVNVIKLFVFTEGQKSVGYFFQGTLIKGKRLSTLGLLVEVACLVRG